MQRHPLDLQLCFQVLGWEEKYWKLECDDGFDVVIPRVISRFIPCINSCVWFVPCALRT